MDRANAKEILEKKLDKAYDEFFYITDGIDGFSPHPLAIEIIVRFMVRWNISKVMMDNSWINSDSGVCFKLLNSDNRVLGLVEFTIYGDFESILQGPGLTNEEHEYLNSKNTKLLHGVISRLPGFICGNKNAIILAGLIFMYCADSIEVGSKDGELILTLKSNNEDIAIVRNFDSARHEPRATAVLSIEDEVQVANVSIVTPKLTHNQ